MSISGVTVSVTAVASPPTGFENSTLVLPAKLPTTSKLPRGAAATSPLAVAADTCSLGSKA